MTTTAETGVAAAAALTVAQIAAEQCWADPSALARNAEKVAQCYQSAADDSDLVVFPELILTGYIPLKGYDQTKKRILSEVASRVAGDALPRLAALTQGRRAAIVCGFMEPTSVRYEMHNSVAVLQDGEILGVYRKMHLPVEENHYFIPGDEAVVVDCRAGRIGLNICYDMVFPEAARLAALRGAELLCVPSNWLAIEDLQRLGDVLPVARALEHQMHVVFANGVGELEVRGRHWNLYGTSTIVNAVGQKVARAGAGEEILKGSLPASSLAEAANVFPIMRDRRPDAYGDIAAPLSSFAGLRRSRRRQD
ncbi:MAG TPA: carbon-nitrogen hydrolase family protein [Xanthobacteraceae bacterium]